jgi:hypothetical protein
MALRFDSENEMIASAIFMLGEKMGKQDPGMQNQLQALSDGWEDLQTRAKSEKLTAEEKAKYGRVATGLAKGLTDVTKGALAAKHAFEGGNPMAGSAAIMDICSSVASMIGAISAAGGPVGALIGALFSMVSQILTFFAPPAESLTDQIEKLIVKLEGKDKWRQIRAA